MPRLLVTAAVVLCLTGCLSGPSRPWLTAIDDAFETAEEELTAVMPEREATASPIVPDNEWTEISLPDGWQLDSIGNGTITLTHPDDLSLTVTETETACSYHLTFRRDRMSCVVGDRWPLEEGPREVSRMHQRVDGDGNPVVVGLILDWPLGALNSLRDSLDPVTRRGVCTR